MRNFGNTNEEEGLFNSFVNYVTGEGIVEDVLYYTTPGEGFWANEENSSNTNSSSSSSNLAYDYQDLISNYSPSQQEAAQNNTVNQSNTFPLFSSNAPANTVANTAPNTSRGSNNTTNTPRSNTSNTPRRSGSSRSPRTTISSNLATTAANSGANSGTIALPTGEAMKKNLISAAAGVAVGVTLMAIITSLGD